MGSSHSCGNPLLCYLILVPKIWENLFGSLLYSDFGVSLSMKKNRYVLTGVWLLSLQLQVYILKQIQLCTEFFLLLKY